MPARRREAQSPGDPFEAIGCDDVAPIGSGGSSMVYRARQRAFDRLIALKVLITPFADQRSRRRFERELALAGRLTGHPNVVTVFASGFLGDGRAYVEMEYCPGGSLADRLAASGPLPVQDVVSIGVKIAGVLALAHQEGIIHRDVKPANVLVTRFGEPALADFGIATVAGELTGTTQALTPVHAAPEVLESRAVGPAADQWSLGSTLHTLLAGRAPFATVDDEGLLAGMLRILNDPVPVIPRGDVPETLRSVLERAMAKDPAARWAGPTELGRALQEVERREGWPVTTLPSTEEVAETRYGGGAAPDRYLPPGDALGAPGGSDAAVEPAGPAARPGSIWPAPLAAGVVSAPSAPAPAGSTGPGAAPRPPGVGRAFVDPPTETWSRRPPVTDPAGPGGQRPEGPAGAGTGPHASGLIGPAPPGWHGPSAPVPPGSAGSGPGPGGDGTDPLARAPLPPVSDRETTQHWDRLRRVSPPPAAPTPGGPPRSRLWVAVAAAVAVIVAVAVAVTVLTRSQGGRVTHNVVIPPARPDPARYAPVGLEVVSYTQTTATLRWKDPDNGAFPFVVEVLGANPQPAPPASPATPYRQAVIEALDPTKGYCFTVGAEYDLTSKPAYAAPVCIRGAHAVTTTAPAAHPGVASSVPAG